MKLTTASHHLVPLSFFNWTTEPLCQVSDVTLQPLHNSAPLGSRTREGDPTTHKVAHNLHEDEVGVAVAKNKLNSKIRSTVSLLFQRKQMKPDRQCPEITICSARPVSLSNVLDTSTSTSWITCISVLSEE